jgi:hypothetical protein
MSASVNTALIAALGYAARAERAIRRTLMRFLDTYVVFAISALANLYLAVIAVVVILLREITPLAVALNTSVCAPQGRQRPQVMPTLNVRSGGLKRTTSAQGGLFR